MANNQKLMQDVQAIVNQQAGGLHRVHLFNSIPQKTLTNARRKYAKALENNETVIALYDNSRFGSGKSGFILTADYLYGRDLAGNGIFIHIKDVTQIIFEEPGVTIRARVHSPLRLDFARAREKGQDRGLFMALGEIIELLDSRISYTKKAPTGYRKEISSPKDQSTTPVSVPVYARCRSCGATGKIGTLCKFCRNVVEARN
ncbi:MAG: hypothetical protein FWC99_06515 [Coriobacteriia bacterium]|nr:hypothetical protein [Coriobacteriia bacterium]